MFLKFNNVDSDYKRMNRIGNLKLIRLYHKIVENLTFVTFTVNLFVLLPPRNWY